MFKINFVLDLIGMIRLIFQLWIRFRLDTVYLTGSGSEFRAMPGLIRNQTGYDLFYIKCCILFKLILLSVVHRPIRYLYLFP
jgi:hypothetical protein